MFHTGDRQSEHQASPTGGGKMKAKFSLLAVVLGICLTLPGAYAAQAQGGVAPLTPGSMTPPTLPSQNPLLTTPSQDGVPPYTAPTPQFVTPQSQPGQAPGLPTPQNGIAPPTPMTPPYRVPTPRSVTPPSTIENPSITTPQ